MNKLYYLSVINPGLCEKGQQQESIGVNSTKSSILRAEWVDKRDNTKYILSEPC